MVAGLDATAVSNVVVGVLSGVVVVGTTVIAAPIGIDKGNDRPPTVLNP